VGCALTPASTTTQLRTGSRPGSSSKDFVTHLWLRWRRRRGCTSCGPCCTASAGFPGTGRPLEGLHVANTSGIDAASSCLYPGCLSSGRRTDGKSSAHDLIATGIMYCVYVRHVDGLRDLVM